MQTFRPATLLKGDSNTVVFLTIFKKKHLFTMFFIPTFFSTARQVAFALHNKKAQPMRSSTNEGLILDQCNGKIKLITLYAVHLELITEAATRGVL